MSDNNLGLNNEECVALNVHIPCELKDKLKFCSYKEKNPLKIWLEKHWRNIF